MEIGLDDICREINNWFDRSRHFGVFSIVNGSIDVSMLVNQGSLQNGQYFRIVGSVFNDGVYQYPTSDLTDETFDGAIWAMAVPPTVIALLLDINDWTAKNMDAINSPYFSESFGGYSYQKSISLQSGDAGSAGGWKYQFKSQLDKWRKIRP